MNERETTYRVPVDKHPPYWPKPKDAAKKPKPEQKPESRIEMMKRVLRRLE